MNDQAVPQFDVSIFSTNTYVRRVEKPWGYELHLVPADKPYMFKVMHLNARARMSLQVHDAKQETYLVTNGRAGVIWETSDGELKETELLPGQGYSTSIGQRHRLYGITDCDIIEASTPEMGTTWRLEDDYTRPDETTEQREIERS